MSRSRVCALVSGLDSCAMIYELLDRYDEVYPVYIKFGLRWEDAELYWLKRFLEMIKDEHVKGLKVLESSLSDVYSKHWSITGEGIPDENASWDSVYLPGRNLLLLTTAVTYCVNNKIYNVSLATLKDNPFKDATKLFFKKFEDALSIGFDKKISIVTPFINKGKSSIIKKYKDSPLHLTFSCINPRGLKHCGICNKCYERKKYFKKTNIEDKTIYAKEK